MRQITTIALAVGCLLVSSASMAESTAGDFNAAWRAYSAAIEADDNDKVLAASRQVLDIGREIFPAEDGRLPILMSNYAAALDDAGQEDEAQDLFDESIDLAEEIHGKDSIELVDLLNAQADASHDIARGVAPTGIYRRILKIVAKQYGQESLEYASTAFLSASKLVDQSRSLAGKSWMQQAHDIYTDAGESQAFYAGATAFYLGKMEFSERDNKQAVNYLLEAVDKLDPEIPKARLMLLPARALLVQALEEQGRSDEATEHCVAIGRESMFSPDQDYAPIFRIAPMYPAAMLRTGKEGFVDISFTVDENGIVREPVVLDEGSDRISMADKRFVRDFPRATDRSFEAAALGAVKRFRYAPQFRDGKAVATENVKTRITFKIE